MGELDSLPPSNVDGPHLLQWQRLMHYAAYLAYAALAFLPPLVQFVEKNLFPWWRDYGPFSAYAVQVSILVFLVCIAGTQTAKTWKEKCPRPSRAVEQFQSPWVKIWAVWVLFYSLLAAREFLAASGHQVANSPLWDLGSNLLNNLQSVYVLLCYIYLSTPTASENQSKDNLQLPLLAIWFLLGCGNWVYIIAADPKPGDLGLMVLRLISGLIAGTALALFVGQLGRHYIVAPRPVIILLFLYAVIQLSYADFGGQQPLLKQPLSQTGVGTEKQGSKSEGGHPHLYAQEIITAIALPLKLLLFGLVHSLLKTGRLLFFMKKARELYDDLPTEWDMFQKEFDQSRRN